MSDDLKKRVQKSKQASKDVAQLSAFEKEQLLKTIARMLIENSKIIISENKKDLEFAKKKSLSDAMVDRLVLNEERIKSMAGAVTEIARQEDPIGKMTASTIRPNGIKVAKMSIPLGVIAMIYESRPNVTSDAAALCLKAGNAVVLRGGSEAFNSNMAITKVIHQALAELNIPDAAVTFVPTTDRGAMAELLTFDELIDLVIPRGGEGLIRFVAENSRIPVIKHYKGVCHLYVDESADLDKALKILVDGKVSRPGVCNALETLLVHKSVIKEFAQKILDEKLMQDVEIKGCEITKQYLPAASIASETDYAAEFLAKIIAVKVVGNMYEALDHIKEFSSDHTEVIVTNNLRNADEFVQQINSAVVMVNASSRFSDGGELGLGAEIGISTTKLHAYGPMGIESLTTQKFVVTGDGQTRHNLI